MIYPIEITYPNHISIYDLWWDISHWYVIYPIPSEKPDISHSHSNFHMCNILYHVTNDQKECLFYILRMIFSCPNIFRQKDHCLCEIQDPHFTAMNSEAWASSADDTTNWLTAEEVSELDNPWQGWWTLEKGSMAMGQKPLQHPNSWELWIWSPYFEVSLVS